MFMLGVLLRYLDCSPQVIIAEVDLCPEVGEVIYHAFVSTSLKVMQNHFSGGSPHTREL